jgi:hypothetical protein
MISRHAYALITALRSMHIYVLTGIYLFIEVAYRSTQNNLT